MARKRMLSPDFFSSKPVNNLSLDAMLTFAGLWVYLDDYGRGEDDADLIKSTVWPRRRTVTEKKVRAHLDAIEKQSLICRYVVADCPLIHIPSWSEHQKISHPTDSRIPPCPSHERAVYEEFLNGSDPARERFRSETGAVRE